MFAQFAHELSVLSRAVGFKNLSAASNQIGLSQPQLSRIVIRLEKEFGVTLLDRDAKRKTSWTPVALELARCFVESERGFERRVLRTFGELELKDIKIGTLEGLSSIALELCESIYKEVSSVQTVEVDVYDLALLESLFMSQELDLILSFREPGRRKHLHVQRLGYQEVERKTNGTDVMVLSPYEFSNRTLYKPPRKGTKQSKLFISNSLEIRRQRLMNYTGVGDLPGEVQFQSHSPEGSFDVLLIGSEQLQDNVWKKVKASIQDIALKRRSQSRKKN